MQTAGVNGHLDNQQDQTLLDATSSSPIPDTTFADVNPERESSLPLIKSEDDHHEDGPPAKRRKVAESHKSSPRPVSPPWKRVHAEGPTSFVEGGRRKSGRTNLIPLELQPQSDKRQTRTAFHKHIGDQKFVKPSYNIKQKKLIETQPPRKDLMAPHSVAARPPKNRTSSPEAKREAKPKPSSPTAARIVQLEAQLAKLEKQRRYAEQRRRSDVNGTANGYKTDSDEDSEDSKLDPSSVIRGPTPPLTLRKVAFKVQLPKPTVAAPYHIPLPKKFESFQDFLERDEHEPRTGQDLLSDQQIRKEATIRFKVRQAQQPGGVLSGKRLDDVPDKQEEPRKQFFHRDHLLAHVAHFRKLMREERRSHRRRAEILAHEAKREVERRRQKSRVKTKEEVEQEEYGRNLTLYRSVIKDMEKLWLAVLAEVQMMRQKEYEEQQQAQMKGHLARVLDRTDQMLNRAELDSSMVDSGEEDLSGTDTGSEDSEQMSRSGSESSSETEQEDDDAEMTLEELQAKYANVPEMDEALEIDTEMTSKPVTDAEEDSDPETEMDSEFDTDESDEEASDEDEGEPEANRGLLGLFSKHEIAEMAPEDDSEVGEVQDETETPLEIQSPLIEELDIDLPTAEEEASADIPTKAEPEPALHQQLTEVIEEARRLNDSRGSSEDQLSHDPSTQASPTGAREPESVSSVEPPAVDHMDADEKSSTQTPVPSLLRGTLRIYQHEGLDWLANLYSNGRSGILADEMGLGKTIQSIALLAHLAEVHEVWGPHLIVVPTSVMLNWEMEFKKFLPGFKILTYYGSQEERKQKRRGWMADDSFNVCITSYQLVLQDANSFKRRRWHYMILDEAHNIKNFRSERWQTMMTFNTQARLLLTGTPLQNNLTELWSLLFFLHYGQETDGEDDAFAGLKEWSEWFKRPVESILEHNKQILDEEDKEQVAKLHKVIRPFLLRRLKADVEKQMPLKYEHVEMCRLSKRQRQLYDGFMSRAQTKETLASGNYLSIINALMQLRKVCNHPDLFETRPINTSFAMSKAVAADFEIQNLLVKRKLIEGVDNLNLDFLQLVPISNESKSMIEFQESTSRHAYLQLKALYDNQWRRSRVDDRWHGESRKTILSSLDNAGRRARLNELNRTIYVDVYRHHEHPLYGRALLHKLKVSTAYDKLSHLSGNKVMTRFWERENPVDNLTLVQSTKTRSDQMSSLVDKYACITPAVVANDFSTLAVTEANSNFIRSDPISTSVSNDPFHLPRMRMSIAFPDKRLLQYDCGKLQRLDKLLRTLQAGGHRALIFTQMTKVLDILEQFLNIHGHRYLRLDGATKIEQRQLLTERFNNDPRILAFILSSRSGGLGINLTGADTVIFYDLDWNPAMDKQCTDRAHRIGQTRDVHIYRFVSEHTIESNILRKANQKQILDNVVIQEGEFTTDYLNKLTYRDMLEAEAEDDVAGAAMDRVLGQTSGGFEQAEDKEDIAAAKVAQREVQHADDGDFDEKAIAAGATGSGTPVAQTPGPMAATNAALAAAEDVGREEGVHVDFYMLRLQKWLLRDVPLAPRENKKKKRDEHRVRKR